MAAKKSLKKLNKDTVRAAKKVARRRDQQGRITFDKPFSQLTAGEKDQALAALLVRLGIVQPEEE